MVFDLLARVFRANGYDVTYARNITDIDDKIIKKALEQKKDIKEITDFYTEAFHKEMASIGVSRPDIEPKATESLEAMYELIGKLIDSKHAYKTDEGDVYFDTSSDSEYLKLSHRVQDEDDKQQRVESSSQKKNPADFALWKSVKEEHNCLPVSSDKDALTASYGFISPFGHGRPGWHLECSAMIEKHLAKPNTAYAVDIHGGGADLLFPHHENEAAQTRCGTNHALANYWMHNGFVNIDGEKMSKSLGNSFFLKDALCSYHGEVLRFYLLSTHYRSDFNFNEIDLLSSKKRLDKLYRLKKRLFGMKVTDEKTDFQTDLLEAISDDLNISVALSLVDAMISNANETLDANAKDKLIKRQSLADLAFIEKILGFGLQNPFEYFQFGIDDELKAKIEGLIEKRTAAKAEKDFAASDLLRDELLALDIAIMDTAEGTFWEKN